VPDLIILDIRMPEMDGFQLLDLMRKYPKAAAIPVVMMTALSQPADVDRALALGVVDYLVKPLDPTVLVAKVKEALSHRLPAGDEWAGPNRRQFPRGSILDLDLGPEPGGKGIDISEGGIGWRTKSPPARDEVVVIEAPILFAELRIAAESLRARVVHTRKLGLGYHRVGATFVGLTAPTREALRTYALERQTRGALG
ncbi:MAG: response regulator, partial [Myxococcales bacterium]|nr:response regulator [Myxococcales bacterium]